MWLLTEVVAGAIVPHAPVLVSGVSPATEARTEPIRAAIADLDLGDADVTVVISGHGPRPGVYRDVAGTLDDFGIPGVAAQAAGAGSAGETLARAWGVEILASPADHGIVVPVALLPRGRYVAATLPGSTGRGAVSLEQVVAEAKRFAAAVREAGLGRIALVASVCSAAGLAPCGPLTELPGAAAAEEVVLDAFTTDLGALRHLALRLHEEGGTCSAGPLVALGELFAGAAGRMLAYDASFGVGYPVVSIAP